MADGLRLEDWGRYMTVRILGFFGGPLMRASGAGKSGGLERTHADTVASQLPWAIRVRRRVTAAR